MKILLKRNLSEWIFTENDYPKFIGREKRHLFNFSKTTIVLNSLNGEEISLITSSIFKPRKAKIVFSNPQSIMILKWQNLIYKPYVIVNDFLLNTYEIVPHKDNKFSIFKNNIQIGYVIEKAFYTLNNEELLLIFNSNEDPIVIYSLVLASICSFNENEILNFNFGNTLKERFQFNSDWQPL